MNLSAQNRLILFTRYPIAGQTKTRLIPYLGAEQAADLQRKMTEFIVDTTRPLQIRDRLSLEVHFAGGSLRQMQRWLGPKLAYRPQQGCNLGDRLHHAFSQGFQADAERIVVIGSDCPAISAHHLEQAFHQLKSHDLVLGPAQDGGYYLVGLSRSCAELFQNIAWGTERVFNQTAKTATQHHLSRTTLETH
ncbi:MAG: TIGR04282 family arsenosugar biosynthesis glycosyltransferase [Leptolyngbyaceae cyanobacterium]